MTVNRFRTFLGTLVSCGLLIAAPIACSDSTGRDEPQAPAQLQKLSGDDQNAVVGTELPNPVVVRVLDADGAPVRGQLVNFRVTSGGGSVFSGSALTNANGEAQERWTLGTSTTTPQRLEARAVDQQSGAALVFGTFEATAQPGAPQRLESVTGTPLEGTAGLALGSPITVAVFDQYGNPVPGVTVAWTAAADGSVAPASPTTDAAGRASAEWTLGTQAGAQSATATVAGLTPVTFSVAARAGVPAGIEIVSGSGQSAPVATALGTPLTVKVKDAHGNVVVASAVQWAVVAGSATLGAPQSASGGDGTASNTVTLGTTAGDVRVRASIGTLPAAEFVLTATAGAAQRVEVIDGGAQEGVVGQPLSRALTGVVRDQYGNPVAGATITWTTADGGSFSPASSQSDVDGRVSTTWTLGPTAGAQTARAGSAGLQESLVTATARAAAAAAIAIVGGNGQSAPVGTALGTPLTVRVTDAYGNVVAASAVQWTVVAGAGSVGSAETATGSDGVASNTVTFGSDAGEVRIRASLPSGPSVEFSVVATGGAASRIEIVSGNNQEGVVATYLSQPLVVRALDQHGNPAPGASVRWEGTGQSTPVVTVTDAAGLTSTAWGLGGTAGTQTATARLDGTSIPAVTFTATAAPGTAAYVDIVSGNSQSGTVGQALSQPLVVAVRDNWSNPVPGATVSFTIVSGSGTLDPQQAVADASGRASTTVTLGTTAGPVQIRAQLPIGRTADFTATALPGPLAQLIALSSLEQEIRLPTTTSGGQVRATDQYGNGLGGVSVTWTVLSGGGTVMTPTTSIASGMAQTHWVLGPDSVQTMRASVGAIESPVFTVRLLPAATWSQVALPTTAPLRDIWGTSANNIYAVGDGGTVVHFNGTSWQQINIGTTANLTEVVGTGPSDVRVTGSGERIHFNGSTWGAVTWSPLPSYGYDGPCCGPGSGPQPQIARSAEDHAFAIVPGSLSGGRDTVKHWNGSVWTTVFVLGASERAAVLWIAPDGRALIGLTGIASGYHFDGSTWRSGLGGGRVMSYKGKAFTDVFITMNYSGGCCYFSHSNGTVWDYNGSPGVNFSGVPLWFVSPTEVYYRDGTGVRRLTSTQQFAGAGTAEGVNGTVMWGTSSTNLYLIGLDGALWRKSPP